MLNFDKDKYNEITYQLIQSLLFKVTDGLLAVSFESKERKLNLRAYLDIDKTSGLDEKLMADFEAEIRKRLPSYEIEFLVNKVSSNEFATNKVLTNDFDKESFSNDIFLRFNELWW